MIMNRTVHDAFNLDFGYVIGKLKETKTRNPEMVLVVESFFKDSGWIKYLLSTVDLQKLLSNFKVFVSKYFNVLAVSTSEYLDFVAIVDISDTIGERELKLKIDKFETELIKFFFSEEFLGRIKKCVDVFRTPFKDFFDFSVGYSFVESHDKDSIIRSINIALKRAENRRNRKMSELLEELLEILDKHKLQTYFQPIIDVKEGKIFAYEALVRGPRDSKLKRPDLMFKIATLNNLELELDRLTRKIHLNNFKIIQKEDPNARISINLAPSSPLFTDEVKKDIRKFEIPKDQIIWEISENTYIDDFSAFSRAIDALISNGYVIAIDDFGSGITSLKMVFSTPSNIIKIDRDLVKNVCTDTGKQDLLKRIITSFYKPNFLSIIEGIETSEDFRTLIDIGFRYYQGFFFFKPSPKPVPNEAVKEKLKGWSFDKDKMFFPMYFNPR